MIPLVQAVKYGDSVMAYLLLQAGAADVNMADNDPTNPKGNATDKFTPLMFAAAAGDLHMCRLLYGYGADVNAQVQGFWTALHDDASQEHLHIADWLFKHGAKLLQNDDQHATWLAAWANKAKLMELFIEQHEQSYPGSNLTMAVTDALFLGAEDSARVLMFHGHHSHDVDRIEDCKLKPMSTVSCKTCFSVACYIGSIDIMYMMISYNPQLLQEKYLLGPFWSYSSRQYRVYAAALVELGKQPLSLQWLCKSVILCHFGGKSAQTINEKIKRLHLSSILKSYLKIYDPYFGQ